LALLVVVTVRTELSLAGFGANDPSLYSLVPLAAGWAIFARRDVAGA
jgi:hypothetical protein